MQLDTGSSHSLAPIEGNMPFIALYPSARLALWGLRYWSACARQQRCPARLLRDVYASAGVPNAPDSINVLMRVFAAAARHAPQLGCPACPRLTDDEAAILNLMVNIQAGGGMSVDAGLSAWLPGRAVDIAAPALLGLARMMLRAGYDLRSARVPELPRAPMGARLH